MWLLLASLIGICIAVLLPFLLLPWYIACLVCFLLIFCPVRKSDFLRRCVLFSHLRLRMQYVALDKRGKRPAIPSEQQFVFAVAPHGPFCFSMMLTWVARNAYSPLSQGGDSVVPLVASQLLRVPLLGSIAQALGCEAVTRDNYLQHLQHGRSVALAPGGTREMRYSYLNREGKIAIVRRDNPNWLEHAYNTGVSVVPVLSVGETAGHTVFKSFSPLQRLCQRLFGYPFPILAFGTYGTVWPRKSELRLMVGDALQPQNYDSAQQLGEAYYAELEQLADLRQVELEFVAT